VIGSGNGISHQLAILTIFHSYKDLQSEYEEVKIVICCMWEAQW